MATTYSDNHAMILFDGSATSEERNQENDHPDGHQDDRSRLIAWIHEVGILIVDAEVCNDSDDQYCQT